MKEKNSEILEGLLIIIFYLMMVFIILSSIFIFNEDNLLFKSFDTSYKLAYFFVISTFFGIQGIFALSLKVLLTKNNLPKVSQQSKNTRVEDPNASWTCPKCNAKNNNQTYSCKSCGYSLQ